MEAPISFKEALNNEGFDLDFNNNSYESTINLDRTMKEKGLIFDGFTYYKTEMSPRKKSAEQRHITEEDYSPS